MPPDAKDFKRRLEAGEFSEGDVRKMLTVDIDAKESLSLEEHRVAREYLKKKEQERDAAKVMRQEARQEKSLKIAVIALVVAVLGTAASMIISIVALLNKGG